MPFTALGLTSNITKAVREAGYTEPTPIQTKAIPVVLSGADVIGIAQTGTGKTAAFVLPILQRLASSGAPMGRRGMRALIVAPTRELVVQIEENVRKYSKHLRFRAATVFGGVGEQPQIKALRSGAEIVIATPGRLIDLMQQGHVDFSILEVAVLDEADRMLDMGFLPAMRRIVSALPKDRQTLMFSATLSKDIESLTHEMLRNPEIVQVGRRSNPAETVTQFVYEVPKAAKMALLQHLLRDTTLDSVLVFSRTKHGADKIARKLSQKGFTTATLHSNRSQNQRLAALKAFKSGAVRVLVATDIAARGIDVEGISHVINFDFPPQPEDYVHRIGRTGRAKAVGDAISFVSPEEAPDLRALERFISRGIPRKVAEGFDARAAEQEERDRQDTWVRENPNVPARGPRTGHRQAPAADRRQPSTPAGRSASSRPQERRPAGAGQQRTAGSGRPHGRPQASGRPQAPSRSSSGSRPSGGPGGSPPAGRRERKRTW